MIEYILLHVCAPPTRRRDRSAATPGCGSSGEGPQQSWAPYWGDCSCIIFLVIYRSMTCSWSYKSTTQRSGLQGLNIHDCLLHRRKSSNSWCWTILADSSVEDGTSVEMCNLLSRCESSSSSSSSGSSDDGKRIWAFR